MAIHQTANVRFTPRGLGDAFDATDTFAGACRKLTNLVFDGSNPEVVVARSGVGTAITSFPGFSSPGFVSLQVVIGDRIYGMLATGLTPGFDQPFCYTISTNSFVAISGVTAGNAEGRPASPATTGPWVPPSLAIVGSKVIITHPGYTGTGSNFFGVIDISTYVSPAYSTVNTSTNVLPTAPTFVANLNNRAYFACGNTAYYSDVLLGTKMTNAGQSLTLGDTTPITAMSGLPVQTTTGGVVAAMIVFKPTQIWQVTGDAAITGSLSLNYLSLNIGSVAPRSIVPTPAGTYFAGPDSLYAVSPFGAVNPVTAGGPQQNLMPDLRQPFGYVTTPSRVAAAYAANIYRICIPTIIDGLVGTYDYWFDSRKNRWNGPHTFIYDDVSSAGTYFIVSGYGSGAALFASYPFTSNNSVFNDNGATFNIDMKSADFPKKDEMAMKQVVECTAEFSSSGQQVNYGITAFDDKGNVINTANVVTPTIGGVWGTNLWGDGTRWATALNQPRTYAVNWSVPIVFNKMAIEIVTVAAASVSIGTFYARTQKTGYLLQP